MPGDRHADGAIMTMSARENLTLPDLGLRRRGGRLDARAERREVRSGCERIELRPADPERPLELFSGGNQQKVVLAKWLRNEPRVLLLDEPTQGVDVGAKAAIYELIADAAGRRRGRLIASSDTAELASVCDRVLVMRDGARVRGVDGRAADRGAPRHREPRPQRPTDHRRSPAMTDLATVAAPAARRRRSRARHGPVLPQHQRALHLRRLFVLFALWVPDTFLRPAAGGRCSPTRP